MPETVLLLLFVGAILSLGMVGFSAGLSGRRSPLTAIVMIVVLGAVITLIVDIDRPQGGTLTVSQQPLEELFPALIGAAGNFAGEDSFNDDVCLVGFTFRSLM